jgi:L-lactate dehydrogenase complex protein LldG
MNRDVTRADAMLARVRHALGHPRAGDGARVVAVERRLASPPRRPIPTRASGPATELGAHFVARLREQSATVIEVAGPEAIPGAIAAALAELRLPARLRYGDDPFLAGLPWHTASSLAPSTGPAEPADEVGLSHAVAGIAETGTLVLASGAANPTTLAFLPKTHFVGVNRTSIVGALEEAFDAVRAELGRHTMPRSLNLISGPSRTGDIGGRLVMGAHGPQRLIVIVY